MNIKRKLTFLSAIGMAFLLSVTSVLPIFADDSSTTETASIDGLVLIAPVTADINESITLTVLKRSDVTPVENASIWSVSRENIEALNAETAAITSNSSTEADLSAILSVYGEYIGSTNSSGLVNASFPEQGRYMLLAVKQGYIPGRTHIAVGTFLPSLSVSAPDRVDPDEPFTLTVTQNSTNIPVESAKVWALTREDAEIFRTESMALVEENGTALTATEWESLVSVRGILLGNTNDAGELDTSIANEGGYLLLAIKSGFVPGRTGLLVKEIKPTLSIKSWRWAQVDESVTMTVTNAASGESVDNAMVWALTIEQAESFRAEIDAMRESETDLTNIDWNALVGIYGTLLGTTDTSGELTHAFTAEGNYILITVKADYLPGRTAIRVLPDRDSMDGTITTESDTTATPRNLN